MKIIKQALRVTYIFSIGAKYKLDEALLSFPALKRMRYFIYLNPYHWLSRKKYTPGESIRRTFETLGPLFIKFGQALSTRPDLLPISITTELAKLQDHVTPFSSQEVQIIIEETYGKPAAEVFAEFDEEALACASIAQVHAAILLSGEAVVVKLLRPKIKKIIDQDLANLYSLARILTRLWPRLKRFKPKEIIKEFELSIKAELDLQQEAANTTKIKQNFNGSPLLYVPHIYWDYTRENIMVAERIYGIPIADHETLGHYGIDFKRLAENCLEVFFTQVFKDSFFHADMHPGNIFVAKNTQKNPQIICVDFGIVGTLTDKDKRYLGENLLAFLNRDYRKVAQLHIESGWVAEYTRLSEFESAIRTVCEPIFEKPLKEISIAVMVLKLFQVARRFEVHIQPQLVLLQKTLFAVEGLSRQLYPDLILWETAKPFIERWIKQEISPKALLGHLRENIPFFIEQLPYLPKLISDVLVLAKTSYHIDLKEKEAQKNTKPQKNNQKIKNFGLMFFSCTTTALTLFIIYLHFQS